MSWADRLGLGRVVQALVVLSIVAVWSGFWRAPRHSLLPQHQIAFAMVWTLGCAVVLAFISHRRRSRRRGQIDGMPIPRHVLASVRKAYPNLSDPQLAAVERGLRQFFHCHLNARRAVAMPSHVVAAMWAAFAADTRAYERFCRAAFGRPLAPSSAETLGQDAERNDGLRRTWYHACKLEGIDPRTPASLPLLFALDAQLAIPSGVVYLTQRPHADRSADGGVHFGVSFGCGSEPGDAEGFGGEAGGGSDGGSGDGGGGGGGD